MARRTWVLVVSVIIALAGFLAVGWVATREEIASGTGQKGDWRVVASWDFGSYCVKRYHDGGEGGACGFAQPGTLGESMSWTLVRGEGSVTLVVGPVPPPAVQVRITPEEGDPVMADLAKVIGMTFFSAEVPGVQAVNIEALDGSGEVVQGLPRGPLPRPFS